MLAQAEDMQPRSGRRYSGILGGRGSRRLTGRDPRRDRLCAVSDISLMPVPAFPQRVVICAPHKFYNVSCKGQKDGERGAGGRALCICKHEKTECGRGLLFILNLDGYIIVGFRRQGCQTVGNIKLAIELHGVGNITH